MMKLITGAVAISSTVLIIILLLVLTVAHPHASEISEHCKDIREVVATMKSQGKTVADMEAMARAAGATDEMVSDAKACLVRKHGVK
jgi:hypothetical protein